MKEGRNWKIRKIQIQFLNLNAVGGVTELQALNYDSEENKDVSSSQYVEYSFCMR